jgi:CubicO group peptidase (beta-lactamase class C family)
MAGGAFLSKPATHEMMAQHAGMPPPPGLPAEGFGYGFETRGEGRTRLVMKRGGSAGASTRFDIFPELGYTIIVLSNYDTVGSLVADALDDLVTSGVQAPL